MNNRNIAIDIVKAIGILMMIIGHCGQIPYMPYRHFIFTFHMPLFFIISGFFYKKKDIAMSLKSDAKHLLLPYLLSCGMIVVFFLILSFYTHDYDKLFFYLKATIVGSGTKDHSALYLSNLPDIGAIWFFPALFVCKNLYNIMSSFDVKKRLLYSSFIFVTATLIGRYLLFIPFSILSGMSAIIFYAIGDFYKTVQPKLNVWHYIVGFCCWIVSFFYSYVNLVQPRMDLYFVDVISATAATLCVYQFAKKIMQFGMSSFLSWIGCNSMYILCFHNFDFKIGLSHKLAYNGYYGILLSLAIPLLLTLIYTKIIKKNMNF